MVGVGIEPMFVCITVNIDWCNGHGSCHRYGSDLDNVTCCCDHGMYIWTGVPGYYNMVQVQCKK